MRSIFILLVVLASTCTAQVESQFDEYVVKGVPKSVPELPQSDDPEVLEEYVERLDKLSERFRTVMTEYIMESSDKKGEAFNKYVEIVEKSGGLKPELYPVAKGAATLWKIRSGASPEECAKALASLTEYYRTKKLTVDDARFAVMAGNFFPDTSKSIKRRALLDIAEVVMSSGEDEIRGMGKHVAGIARRIGLEGEEFELEGTTVSGDRFEISELRGNYVLVDFWATWCGPCLAEQPELSELLSKYRDKGFRVVGVSMDEQLQTVKKFLNSGSCVVSWPTLHGGDSFHPSIAHYGVTELPTTFLLDKEGKVLRTNARGEDLRKELEKIFDSNPTSDK